MLRFYTEQVTNWEPSTKVAPLWYPVSGEAREILVLAEATVDLATGTASPQPDVPGLRALLRGGLRHAVLHAELDAAP